jgi:hypothetical protein
VRGKAAMDRSMPEDYAPSHPLTLPSPPFWGRGILLALSLLPAAALAQSPLKQSEWLPPGSAIAGDLLERPREALEGGERQNFYVEFGRLAFRSPEILGGNARRAGISCNACHSSGHVNARFFVPGVSDRPGRVDVTHALWNHRGEDGRFNPLDIPTLRNVFAKARLGRDGRVVSLREFARNVIVLEFGGDEPSPLLLDALTAYMQELRTPSDPAPEAVTPAADLADLRRGLAALQVPLLDEDAALAELAIRMIRGQAGLVAERFHLPQHEEVRAALARWTDGLRSLDSMVAAGDFPAARRKRSVVDADLVALALPLGAAAPTSLYDPATVRALAR